MSLIDIPDDFLIAFAVWAVCTIAVIAGVTHPFRKERARDGRERRLPPVPLTHPTSTHPRSVQQAESARMHARERALVERTEALIHEWSQGGEADVSYDVVFASVARQIAKLELRLAEYESADRRRRDRAISTLDGKS